MTDSELALLFRKYSGPLYSFIHSIVRDPGLAEDATQEVFAGLATSRRKPDTDQVRAWLYRVAANQALQVLRREKRRETHQRRAASARSGRNPSDLVERIQEEIQSLDPELRTAILLRYQHGLSYEEMAQVLERPQGTVSWQVSEAREALRRRLGLASIALPSLEDLVRRLPIEAPPRRLLDGFARRSKHALARKAAAVALPLAAAIVVVLSLMHRPPTMSVPIVRESGRVVETATLPADAATPAPSPTAAVAPFVREATFRLSIVYPSGDSVADSYTEVTFQRMFGLESRSRSEKAEPATLAPSRWERSGSEVAPSGLGPFTAKVSCAERTLFRVEAHIVFSAPRGAIAYVLAGPGDVVDLKLEVDKYEDYFSKFDGPGPEELLLQEIATRKNFGAVRGRLIGAPGKGYSVNLLKEPDRHQWFSTEEFLLIPLDPGRVEMEFRDDCCTRKATADVRGGQVVDLSIPHAAPSQSSVGGIVLDVTGRPLPGAPIYLYEAIFSGGRQFQSKTGRDGRFLFQGLDPALRDPRLVVTHARIPVDVPAVIDDTNHVLQMPRPRFRLKFLSAADRSPVRASATLAEVKGGKVEPDSDKDEFRSELDVYLDEKKFPSGTEVKFRVLAERFEAMVTDWITVQDGAVVEIFLRN